MSNPKNRPTAPGGMRGIGMLTSVIGVLIAFQPGIAAGHVTIHPTTGSADTVLQTWLTVPHGCDGSSTVAIRVKIPDGVTQVKPQMKAGWKVNIKRRKLAQPITGEGGRTITETVDEVEWRGGPLADELYDDFGMKLKLPDTAGQIVYFPVVQECENGARRWIDLPAGDRKGGELRTPAPGVTVTPKGR